jgi:hypothetical protein
MHKAQQQTEKGNSMTKKTSDESRFAREQHRLTAMGMNALKPIMHLQVSMLRMWADCIERLAGNYEKGVEETATAIKEQSNKERAA